MKLSRVVVSAPGKIILHGEHAVVYGKAAIAVSIGLRTTVVLQRHKNESKVSLLLKDLDYILTWDLTDIQKILVAVPQVSRTDTVLPSDEMLSLIDKLIDSSKFVEVEGVKDAARVFLFLMTSTLRDRDRLPAIEVEVKTALPLGAGLGSSAAYSISLAAAMLLSMQTIPLPKYVKKTPESETTAKDTDSYQYDDIETESLRLVCQWAFEAEKIMHGQPSGIDNSIATYGGALLFQNGEITHLESMPLLSILLIDTQIPRSTRVMVAGVRDRYIEFPTVYMSLFEAVDGICHECIKIFSKIHNLKNEDVPKSEFVRYYQRLESLVDVNQQLLSLFGVSHPSLDSLCHMTSKYGLHTKLTGAGGGGCAITLIPPGTDKDKVAELMNKLQKEFKYKVWQTPLGSRGVIVHEAIPVDRS
ncbi:predicted protein [Nematostella vectensis]|uniref:Mevalonate kinase n=1 Tax=Nematostella vectensis TaxID=45351 RepID=A7SJK4_NEMVE|nr:predicted protein [Nematostella vectensis]|eukprot:XP_001628178.1 predicted protein [Nematostella vectensis]